MATKSRREEQDKFPRFFAYSLSLLARRGRVNKILQAHGTELRFGLPRKSLDSVVVWGRTKTALRGQKIAEKRSANLVTLEDGFLRSMGTGRQGDPTLSLVYDRTGIYFDPDGVSDFRALMDEARIISDDEFALASNGLQTLQKLHLSKYNAFQEMDAALPKSYVLVVDQSFDDASVRLGGADQSTFDEMLRTAISENPKQTILIKTHPETLIGKRRGYYSTDLENGQVQVYTGALSPWALFDRASKVYCVTSQMGMEAIFAGHRPVVFGRAFYAGWGMTDDRHPQQSYHGVRSAVHLFWAAYLHYSIWYDPYAETRADFDIVSRILAARARHWRSNTVPSVCMGIRLWKRSFFKQYLSGTGGTPRFVDRTDAAVAKAKSLGGRVVVWASKETDQLRGAAQEAEVPLVRVEDGFIRSSGLGAELVQPISLAFDDLGIYYDPTRESRLEWLIQNSDALSEAELTRAAKLRTGLVAAKLSKYNIGGRNIRFNPKLKQRLVLIPGQVEDDASILKGTTTVKTNQDLIWAVRQRFPNAFLIYKPHPDVEAGLRKGEVGSDILKGVVDHVATDADIGRLLNKVDIVATMTSLTGFEALLRGKRVVCFGVPFYAGWGLTEDRAEIPSRRQAQVSLDALVHATLIDYPTYWDPVTGDACTPETILHRFEQGKAVPSKSNRTKTLAKLQGAFASYAHLWRR